VRRGRSLEGGLRASCTAVIQTTSHLSQTPRVVADRRHSTTPMPNRAIAGQANCTAYPTVNCRANWICDGIIIHAQN
jgi:hypothetical protein